MKKALSIVAVIALVAVLTVALVACVPSDPAKAEANLKANGYSVTAYDKDSALGLGSIALPEGATNKVVGSKKADKDSASLFAETVTIIYFESKAAAKAYFNKNFADFKQDQKDYKAELKESYDDGDISKEEYENYVKIINNSQAKLSGKIVYSGTKAAIKAAQ